MSQFSNFVKVGDHFTGYQKSISKKSEHFFTELSVNLTSINYDNGYLWGVIEKKIISIAGKKEQVKCYFEG
jgi:hypothetical protein